MGSGPVVVAILSHRDPPLLQRLVNRVLEGERTIALVHHDPRGAPHGLHESDRVRLVPDPEPCDWGRMSLAMGMHRCIAAAHALVPDLEWLLLVSGQDYPAQPLQTTERFLSMSEADVLMRHFEVTPVPEPGETAWQQRCRQRYLHRLRLPGARRSVPALRRPPFDADLSLYIGDMWVNLRRPAVEHFLEQFTRHPEVVRYLNRCSVPDEALVPSMVLNGGSGLQVVNDRRRFIRWVEGRPHPEVLVGADLSAIRDSGDFFARKVDSTASHRLLDDLDVLHAQG